MQLSRHTQVLCAYLSHPTVQRCVALMALTLLVVVALQTDCWAVTDELKAPVETGEKGVMNLVRLGLTGALGYAGIRSSASGNATMGILGFASAFGTWVGIGWLNTSHPITF